MIVKRVPPDPDLSTYSFEGLNKMDMNTVLDALRAFGNSDSPVGRAWKDNATRIALMIEQVLKQ
jgi:hypothetical protein